jgi:hypothetical protein
LLQLESDQGQIFDINEADVTLIPKLQRRSGLVETDSTKDAKIQRGAMVKAKCVPSARRRNGHAVERVPSNRRDGAGRLP